MCNSSSSCSSSYATVVKQFVDVASNSHDVDLIKVICFSVLFSLVYWFFFFLLYNRILTLFSRLVKSWLMVWTIRLWPMSISISSKVFPLLKRSRPRSSSESLAFHFRQPSPHQLPPSHQRFGIHQNFWINPTVYIIIKKM